MKKRLLMIVMATLCLNFSKQANAQTTNQPGSNQPIDVTSKGMQIGDKLPSNLPSLERYKGKFLILDFWATWCSPCVAMIPQLEALQTQFKDQLQILSITYQTEAEVNFFLTKFQKGRPSILPNITGDVELHKLFPHIYLPHYVWIDDKGTVIAITSYKEVTAENIQKALNSPAVTLEQKKDLKIAYDKSMALFLNGNGGQPNNLLHYSILSGYGEGLKGEYTKLPFDSLTGQRVTMTNQPLHAMYRYAYGEIYQMPFPLNRLIIEAADKSNLRSDKTGDDYRNWQRSGKAFCYETIVPPHAAAQTFKLIVGELDRAFPQYEVAVEKRPVMCRVLIRTSNLDKLKSKGGLVINEISPFGAKLRNSFLAILMGHLTNKHMQKSPYPLINGTQYSGRIDIDLEANLSNMAEVNKALEKYDLKFIEEVRNTEMLVIKDKKLTKLN